MVEEQNTRGCLSAAEIKNKAAIYAIGATDDGHIKINTWKDTSGRTSDPDQCILLSPDAAIRFITSLQNTLRIAFNLSLIHI